MILIAMIVYFGVIDAVNYIAMIVSNSVTVMEMEVAILVMEDVAANIATIVQ